VQAESGVVIALDQCLKYERTLEACYRGNSIYFDRLRFERISWWYRLRRDEAQARGIALEYRINFFDEIPGANSFPIEIYQLKIAKDIWKPLQYFERLLGDAHEQYEAALRVSDPVTVKLLGCNLEQIEADIRRVEAKAARLSLIGPELYLAEHMHKDDFGCL
jgi:hypothetical protein